MCLGRTPQGLEFFSPGFTFTNLGESVLGSNNHLTVLRRMFDVCVLPKITSQRRAWMHVCLYTDACACVYSRRASFHVELSGDDALLAEDSGHLFRLATFHCLHQPIIILVPVCVLSMMIAHYQTCLTKRFTEVALGLTAECNSYSRKHNLGTRTWRTKSNLCHTQQVTDMTAGSFFLFCCIRQE